MKVSIITYHDEDNYGATLQAYATYRAIKELGHTPEIINLRMKHKRNLSTKVVFALKRYRFNNFRKKYMPNTTRVYTTVDDLRNNPPVSDVYLVGSDQTWNPTISKDYALAYFLDFGNESQKRISYAASFGTSVWTDTEVAKKEYVKHLLSRFSSLLVREDRAVEICRKEFGVSAKQVVDPVLLFSSYPELTGRITPVNEIVVYKILNDPEFYIRAVDLGNKLDCNVRSIGSLRHPKGIKIAYPERIEKWLSTIAGAKFVFTDSFHGTVISLLYHKQFVVYVGDKRKMSRITSLLGMLGLSNRICSSGDSLASIHETLLFPIDYSYVDEILNNKRALSFQLLRNAIGECPSQYYDTSLGFSYKRIIANNVLVRKYLDFRNKRRDNKEYSERKEYIPLLSKAFSNDTTIISSNCFAGRIMQDLGMQYNSPTLGLYFWGPDYIEFLRNIKYYLKEARLEFVEHSKYSIGDIRRSQWSHWYPIGRLGSKVEIHFLHYYSEKEAAEKWYRRASRVNWNKLFIIGMEQNLCTLSDIFDFNSLPFENKYIFTSRNLPFLESNIFLSEFNGLDEVGDAYRSSALYYRELVKRIMPIDETNGTKY